MTYSEKLKDPRWQRRREEIFELKGCKCTDCECTREDGEVIQVHHLHYLKGREPWEYSDDYLIPLCESCHQNRQIIESEAKEAISILFGKMYVWHIYEMTKQAKRLASEQRPFCVITTHEKMVQPEFSV